MSSSLPELYRRLEEIHHLRSIDELLGWDMQTKMPPKGIEGRAAQRQVLARLAHQKNTDPEYIELVDRLAGQQDTLAEADRVNVREVKRRLDRARKLPTDFVAEVAGLEASTFAAWVDARAADSFAAVAPALERLVELRRQETELVGFDEHPYDALLDVFEPHARLSEIKPLLLSLADELKVLLQRIPQSPERISAKASPYFQESQIKLCTALATAMGFSFESGRLDPSAHPFQSSIGKGDVRITTRFDSQEYLGSVFTTMHETGHALYELGLPEQYLGTPMGSAVSLGIHESQSRLWENMIGRSRPFSVYLYNLIKEYFPKEYESTTPEEIWQRSNRVAPSLIRVAADEISYSLHIVIRMLLEESLIMGTLSVRELPEAWAEQYQRYLGIQAPSDKDGVLQDVHWYTGAIGYFPTYALGNLYAAEFLQTARIALPDLDTDVAAGRFAPLRSWLQTNIHAEGMRYPAQTLVEKVCGKKPGSTAFVGYLRTKFGL